MQAEATVFEAMVADCVNTLYGVALKLTHDAGIAEQLTRRTLVQAFRLHDTDPYVHEGTHVKSWLLTLLRNAFLDEVLSIGDAEEDGEFDSVSLFTDCAAASLA